MSLHGRILNVFCSVKKVRPWTSLVDQWLRLYTSTAEDLGLTPVWETEIPHATTWPKKGQTPKVEYCMTPRIWPSRKAKHKWKTDQRLPKIGVGRGGDHKEDTQAILVKKAAQHIWWQTPDSLHLQHPKNCTQKWMYSTVCKLKNNTNQNDWGTRTECSLQ